ncbi:MAG: endonuclease [Prevotella sp.]|nr:endonuclease [Prevotella sp.]
MKNNTFRSVILFFFVCIGSAVQAQIPSGYYDSASGLTGAELKSALHEIIKDHTIISYAGLLDAYAYTDCRADGTIWDIYSNYRYSINGNCGSYQKEGDCWNREHTWPQSWFNETNGPKSDLFHVYPTDGYVNNRRSSYPYGEVTNPTYTSGNGSKLGPCTTDGYSGTVFEPIDEYKGDIARSFFYMSVRYFGEDSGWGNSDMTNKSVIKPWAMTMLLRWNENDPVSDKEIARNNVIYGGYQGNRNPFIDHPEYARMIWDETWTAGEEYSITCATSSHGAVTAPAQAAAGMTVSVSVIPDEGYELETLTVYKTGDASTTVPVNSDATFVMPEYDVTVSATFHQNNTLYAITLESVTNGTIAASAQSAKVGTPVTLTATPNSGYALYNWYVTKADGSQSSVEVTDNRFIMPACDVTVAATFAPATAGDDYYVKVTSAPDDWSGEYLIVYEDGSKAFNGGLSILDAASNYITVTISDGKIKSNSNTDAAKFTIAKSGSGSGYTIRSASGYYIGQTGDANGLASSTTTKYNNSISLSSKNVDIVSSSAHLRYNSANDQNRFRYFKSSTYTSQQAIQLYKKTSTSSVSVPTYTITFNPNGAAGDAYSQTVEENTPTSLETNTFSYEGHVFDGWNTKDDGTGIYYADEATVSLHDNLTLYAQWEMSYNITVSDTEHGTISASPLTATEGATVTLSAVPAEGYTHYLWTVTDDDGNPVQVTDNQFEMPACDVNVSATFVYVGQPGSTVYRLVTSTDQLTAGSIYLIANKNAEKALGSATNNNRTAVTVMMNDNKDIISDRGDAYELLLGGSTGAWTFYDATNKGYLYAASSDKNYLRTQSTNDANGQWAVSVTGAGIATIKAQGTNTHNLMRYNSGSDIFSCYSSGQQDVSLYVRENGAASTIILADDDSGMDADHNNAAIINAYDSEKVNVVLYGHTFYKDGCWNSLCLPFSLNSLTDTPLDGASIKEFTSASYKNGTLKLNFSNDLNAIEAGKPYIVKWEADNDVTDPIFTEVTISKGAPMAVDKGVVTMLGVYSPLRIKGEDKTILFLGGNNTLYYPDGEQTTNINGFHAYFQLADGYVCGTPTNGGNGINMFVLSFGGEETNISLTPHSSPLTSDSWYTLDGRRLEGQPARKGIYLYGRQKVIVK